MRVREILGWRSARLGRPFVADRHSARWRRALAAVTVPLLALGLAVSVGVPAYAAGDAQVLVNVVAVDPSTGNQISTLAPGQKIGFRVDFSCVAADCTNATVKFDPTQLDPNHQFYRLLVKSGFTPPLSGTPGPVTGSDATGWTVPLGNLIAGQSGQFTLEFTDSQSARGVGWVNYGPERMDYPVSNFPDGFAINQTVHGNADTAIGEQTATSNDVQWNISTPNPSVMYDNLTDPQGRQVGQGGVLATDTNYRFNVGMASGCVAAWLSGNYYGVYGQDVLCASGFTVTQQLPPGAELVSADGNPAVSGSVSTGLILTWTGPDWTASGTTSQMGWGTTRWYDLYSQHLHGVTIKFPRANLAPAGQACDYDAQTAGMRADTSVTYISMPGVPGAVKAASQAPGAGYTVRCSIPFPRAEMDPKAAARDGGQDLPGGIAPVLVPGTGENLKSWSVTVANTANIDGIAVVTDNTLDQPDLPVYQIVAPAGSQIAWTATDGTTTQSGTSVGTATAPSGFRFVSSTVTSPTLPAPNRLKAETNRAAFTVTYNYKVSPGAPGGAQRTNTASAVMTWPGHPEFPDTQLGPTSKTVQLVAPFTRLDVVKYSATDFGSSFTIPATGTRGFNWSVEVRNSGNTAAIPSVTDTALDDPQLPITGIWAQMYLSNGNWSARNFSGQVMLDNGTTASFTNVGGYNAPAGRRIVSASVSGVDLLPGWSTVPSDGGYDRYQFVFTGPLNADATPGYQKTNTATGALDTRGVVANAMPVTASTTVTLVGASPVITGSLGNPTIAGGATRATTTSDVTFTLCGSTSNVTAKRVPFTPEYVFMAPEGWNITAGSASFPAGSVPTGVTFQYRTVTVAGADRQVVSASWPGGTSFGQNTSLPCMSVIARPGSSVPAGTVSVPRGFIGNTGTVLAGDQFTNEFTDTPNIDGNAATTRFSEASAPAGVPVAAVAAMQILKEICLPDASQADGCRWYADPNNRVGVAPNSTSIKYRLTVTNTGNTSLSDVVGYDILPYPGDTGTSDPTAGIQRGSTFLETLQSFTAPTNAAAATFSGFAQPCRPEVSSLTPPNCTNDWGNNAVGARAIRLARPGMLAPGASFSIGYTAAVNGAPSNGAVACNSFAVRATGLSVVSEPSPVCASIEEADLQIVAGTPQLQQGRPGLLPWTVTNNGGAASTQGEVAVKIPAGIQVTSFTPTGWVCTAVDANNAPVYGTAVGPATLTCTPNNPLLKGVPQKLDIPAIATVSTELTIPAHVSGRMYDSNSANNDDVERVTPTSAAGAVGLTKSDGVTTAKPGDTLTYTVTVTNPLDFETLKGASLADVLPGKVAFVSASDSGTESMGTVTWVLPDLAPKATITRTVTVKVQPTIDSASLTNTANVAAPDPANAAQQLTGTANDVDTVSTHPAVALTKGTASPTFTAVGDVVAYTFTLKNTGDVTLTRVSLADPLPGLSAPVVTWPGTAGTLAPGESATATANYTVTQADVDRGRIDNTATVTGTPPAGNPVTGSDTHRVTGTAVPHITLTKTASGTPGKAGDTIAYTFTVVNDGPVSLTHLAVNDPHPGLSSLAYTWPGTAGTLTPGQSVTATATYTVTQGDVDAGSVLNTATANGQTANGTTVSDDASATVAITPNARLSLVKGASYAAGGTGKAGDVVDYTFLVTNTGNVTLTSPTVVETAFSGSDIAPVAVCPTGPLAPSAAVTCTATYTVTQRDVDAGAITNTATAAATPPGTLAAPVSAPSSAALSTTRTALISLVKSASPASVTKAGDIVMYSFLVTNTGTVTLTDPVVTETAFSGTGVLSAIDCPKGAVAPTAAITCTATYTATQADIDTGAITNIATATATPPQDITAPVSAPSSATVNATSTPAIALTKTADRGSVSKAGDVITYSFLVTNTGNVTVTDPVVTETAFSGTGALSAIDCPKGAVAPTAAITCTATYTATQADIDTGAITNTATATATPPAGVPAPTSNPSSALVLTDRTPAIALVKTADPITVNAAGDTIVYSFLVTNNGNVTLKGPVVAETAFSGSGAAPTVVCPTGITLTPRGTTICTASYTVTRADADAGSVSNTAIASATPPTGIAAPTSNPSTATVSIPAAPAITLVKSADRGTVSRAGDVVKYAFLVTNTGNVTLHGVGIDDTAFTGTGSLPAAVCPKAVLTAGESETCSSAYTVTQQDIDAGRIDNTAVAHGAPPSTGAPATQSEPSTAVVLAPAAPALTLVKSAEQAPKGALSVDQAVTYSFVVTNTGNVTLHDVGIDEGEFTGSGELSALVCPPEAALLAPEAQVVCTAGYTVTRDDVDKGTLGNTATAHGTAPDADGPIRSDPSSVTLPGDPQPALSLAKMADLQTVDAAGQKIAYTFTITNTGNVSITDPGVVEGTFTGRGALSDVLCPTTPAKLLPGQKLACTATYVVTAGDLTGADLVNTAMATGTAPLGGSVRSDSATARVKTVAPPLALTGGGIDWLLVGGGAALLLFGGVFVAFRRRREARD